MKDANLQAWTGVETAARRTMQLRLVLIEARNWLVAGLGSKRNMLRVRYWLRLRMHHD